jgi:hypothetical protein
VVLIPVEWRSGDYGAMCANVICCDTHDTKIVMVANDIVKVAGILPNGY